MLPGERGLGYNSDAYDARDRLFAASPDLPPEIFKAPDLSAYMVSPVRDQGGTSSCVGQALASAIEITACARKGSAIRVSPRHLYAIGRELENPRFRGNLTDSGSFPRLVMEAARSRGLLPEKAFPFSESDIDKRPTPADCVASFDARGLAYYRINSRGAERLDAVKSALRRGCCVLFGMQVDRAYQRNEGDTVHSMGASIGGHMQTAVAVDGVTVRVLNSWGTGWGDRGFAHYDQAFFSECEMSDIYAVTFVPEVSDAA